jgi:hypothetical protein
MKSILAIVAVLLLSVTCFPQNVGINNTGMPPESCAMLDISSSSKGILIPRLRTSERLAIVNPVFGLMVFDVDTWSFWYYTIGGVWKEFTNNTDGPKGNAGGDLGGTYPNPHVKGLAFKPFANLNPGHLQIIKWENDADEWQFRNDSLMLPYNVTDTSAGSLFSITNTKVGATGSVIVSRYLTGSGIVPSFSGVWGDHTNGNGVSGTSNSGSGVFGYGNTGAGVSGNSISGIGVYGTSNGGHGVYGDGNSINHAGVYGRNTTGGPAIRAEATTGNSYAFYGTNSSSSGGSRAAMFSNTNTASTATTFEANHSGLGRAAEFLTSNTANTQSAVVIQQNGVGRGLSSSVLSSGGTSPAIEGNNNGSGAGLRGHSVSGMGVYGSSIFSNAGYFETLSPGGTNPTVEVQNSSSGSGITVTGSSTSNSADLGIISNFGTGRTLYAYNSNSSSTAVVAQFSSSGQGTSIQADCNNTTSTAPVAFINNNGNGNSVEAQNQGQGAAAKLTNFNAANTVPVILAEHKGSGRGIDLRMTKTTNNSYGAYIQHDGIGTGLYVIQSGTGKGAEINIGNSANTQPGLFINSAAILGVDISVTGSASPVGLKSTIGSNLSVNNGIAVLGIAGQNDYNGIGVKGIGDGVGATNAIGVLGEGAAGSQAIGVKGTSYNGGETAGAVMGINFATGVGVYGEGQGTDAIGVAGISGNTGNHNVAAMFRNKYNNNNRAVVEILSNGKGNAIFCDNDNLTSNAIQFRVRNAGTGNFLSFENNLGSIITTVAKNGNITTDGTLTVKGDKGIVRNTTNTQLRTEVLTVNHPGGTISAYSPGGFNASIIIPVSFSTAFSSPPVVTMANFVTGSFSGLTSSIINVTTTGCEIQLLNYTSNTLSFGLLTVKLIAIGAE